MMLFLALVERILGNEILQTFVAVLLLFVAVEVKQIANVAAVGRTTTIWTTQDTRTALSAAETTNIATAPSIE